MKTCIACGMPMKEACEYACGDTDKDYCKFCARPDGTMQSFAEKLESLTAMIMRTQGLDAVAAKSIAEASMAKLPAWQAHLS